MALAPVKDMTVSELIEYIEKLETENRGLRKKTDNRRKLDERDAARIRRLHASGNWTQAALADAFNVNDGTISRIVRGVYYAEVA